MMPSGCLESRRADGRQASAPADGGVLVILGVVWYNYKKRAGYKFMPAPRLRGFRAQRQFYF